MKIRTSTGLSCCRIIDGCQLVLVVRIVATLTLMQSCPSTPTAETAAVAAQCASWSVNKKSATITIAGWVSAGGMQNVSSIEKYYKLQSKNGLLGYRKPHQVPTLSPPQSFRNSIWSMSHTLLPPHPAQHNQKGPTHSKSMI
jgi:hypothetical protein